MRAGTFGLPAFTEAQRVTERIGNLQRTVVDYTYLTDYGRSAGHPPQTEVNRVYLADVELLRPELFRTPAWNFSGEYRAIGHESAYCIRFANSSDICPDVDAWQRAS